MTVGKYATGSIAVLVFFTLSGFVITEAADQFYRGRPWAFLMNRLIRIMPQYLVAIAVSIGAINIVCLSTPGLLPSRLVPYACSDILVPFNIFQNILMVFPGVGKDGAPLIPYVWALRVEFLFYLVLAAGLFVRIHKRSFIGRVFVLVTLTIFFLSLIRMAPYSFQYTPYFLLGVVSYLTVSERAVGAPWLLASVFATCLWTCITHSMPDFIPEYRVTSHESVLGIVLYCILNCALLLLANCKTSFRWKKIDSAIGELSFPIYLQQYATLIFVAATIPRSYIAVIAAGILTCVFAGLAALGVERPVRSFRDRVRGSRIHLAAHHPETGQAHPEAAQIGTMRLLAGSLPPSTPSRTRTTL